MRERTNGLGQVAASEKMFLIAYEMLEELRRASTFLHGGLREVIVTEDLLD